MVLKKFYLKCLAHGSYLIADEESREAAIVDPQRDVDAYVDLVKESGYRLKYVLETHVHADFVSGHWELAERTGAQVVFGAAARPEGPHLAAKDGDILPLGKDLRIQVLETPGHTPESVCYLAKDMRHPEEPGLLFSGDTLFDGDVGRPDLLGARMPARTLASMLFDSLETRIKTLPDDVRVYPAHGAGSACGRNIGNAEFTTIGEERRTNPALQTRDREEFIRLVTSDLPEAPAYFSEDARLNLRGIRPLAEVVDAVPRLTPAQAQEAMDGGAVLLDVRSPADYAMGSPPGAVNIPLDGLFATWLGTLIPIGTPLVLLSGRAREAEAITRCARIGFESLRGVLADGLSPWIREERPLAGHSRLSPAVFALPSGGKQPLLLDVRSAAERERGFIPGSVHLPLHRLPSEAPGLASDRPIHVYCESGYRSAMAVSLLKRNGYRQVTDLEGGFAAYAKAGLPVEAPLHA